MVHEIKFDGHKVKVDIVNVEVKVFSTADFQEAALRQKSSFIAAVGKLC